MTNRNENREEIQRKALNDIAYIKMMKKDKMMYKIKKEIIGGAGYLMLIAGVATMLIKGFGGMIAENDKRRNEIQRLELIVKDETQKGELPLFRGSLDELNNLDSEIQYTVENVLFFREYQGGLNYTRGKVYEEIRKLGYDGLVHFNISYYKSLIIIQGTPIRRKK